MGCLKRRAALLALPDNLCGVPFQFARRAHFIYKAHGQQHLFAPSWGQSGYRHVLSEWVRATSKPTLGHKSMKFRAPKKAAEAKLRLIQTIGQLILRTIEASTCVFNVPPGSKVQVFVVIRLPFQFARCWLRSHQRAHFI